MSKFVTVDGQKFVSADILVDAMMERIMDEVYGPENLVVDEDEARAFELYEDLLKRIGDHEIRQHLRDKYVLGRFMARRKLE